MRSVGYVNDGVSFVNTEESATDVSLLNQDEVQDIQQERNARGTGKKGKTCLILNVLNAIKRDTMQTSVQPVIILTKKSVTIMHFYKMALTTTWRSTHMDGSFYSRVPKR